MSNITERLFFALRPDAAALAQIDALGTQLRAEQGLHATLHKPESHYLSLYHLGDFTRFPQAVVDKAAVAGAAAALAAPAFELVLDQVLSLQRRDPRNLPCVLQPSAPNAALKLLRDQLVAGLKATALYRYASFSPQLTLLNDPISVEPQAVEPVRWTVSELLLVKTQMGRGEPVELLRWSLR